MTDQVTTTEETAEEVETTLRQQLVMALMALKAVYEHEDNSAKQLRVFWNGDYDVTVTLGDKAVTVDLDYDEVSIDNEVDDLFPSDDDD